jgi:myo-inositol-1(or 4)-monophosphatase
MTNSDEEIERSALALAQELAREAIELARGGSAVASRKANAFDVVTAADIAIEKHLRQRISGRFPGHAILGEEHGFRGEDRDWTWIVDPIDGTFNYATGLPGAASSIALMHGGETRVGAVADFALDTVFSCRTGARMTWDRGSAPPDVEAAAVLGRARLLIDPGHQMPDPVMFSVLRSFAELAPVIPRLIGSAAVSLAAVALSGGCFVGAGLEIWDAAAGVLLAEERGRAVRWWRFANDSSHHVLAGEPELVSVFEPVMRDFIVAWRNGRDSQSPSASEDQLLGPSPTMLI